MHEIIITIIGGALVFGMLFSFNRTLVANSLVVIHTKQKFQYTITVQLITQKEYQIVRYGNLRYHSITDLLSHANIMDKHRKMICFVYEGGCVEIPLASILMVTVEEKQMELPAKK